MPESVALNQDCLSFMRTLPDNYFDICVADPPYGDALCGEAAADTHTHTHTQARRGTDSGSDSTGTSMTLFRPTDHLHSSRKRQEKEIAVARTGGTWAEKYGKKS